MSSAQMAQQVMMMSLEEDVGKARVGGDQHVD